MVCNRCGKTRKWVNCVSLRSDNPDRQGIIVNVFLCTNCGSYALVDKTTTRRTVKKIPREIKKPIIYRIPKETTEEHVLYHLVNTWKCTIRDMIEYINQGKVTPKKSRFQ